MKFIIMFGVYLSPFLLIISGLFVLNAMWRFIHVNNEIEAVVADMVDSKKIH